MTVEIISWSISTKVRYRVGIELATPGSAVRHASVARQLPTALRGPVVKVSALKLTHSQILHKALRALLSLWVSHRCLHIDKIHKIKIHSYNINPYKADLKKMLVCRAPTYPPKTGPTPKQICLSEIF